MANIDCRTCTGTGRCSGCGGLGFVPRPEAQPASPCSMCFGSGKCPNCDGARRSFANGFEVDFLGEVIRCVSFEHAAAVKVAASVFTSDAAIDYSPEQLEQLASVLAGYGRGDYARNLRQLADGIRCEWPRRPTG